MPKPKVRRLRQRLVLALCGVLLALVGTVVTAQPAAAECTPGNVPQLAGSGLPGLIDDKTSAEDPTTKYGQYGWAGLRWTTCDLDRSALGIPREDTLDVKIDTFLGNLGLGLAVTLAATMTQLHQWAVYPGALLAPIDGLLTDITNAVKDSTWTPWVAAFIIAAAVGVCMIAFRGEVRRAWRTVAAVGLACLAIAWISTPVVSTRLANDSGSSPSGPLQFETVRMSGAEHAATVFDGAAASIVSSVDTNIAKTKPKGDDQPTDDDEARGAILQDKLLWSLWARGELGGQAAAAKYGEDLYKAAAVKWSDAASVDSDKRRQEFSKVAERIQKDDPATYDQLRGASLGRSGYGLLAAVIMGCIALIRIPAELMMIAGLLVMRVLVMFAPVLALAAILESTRPVAKAGLKIAIASVVNVAIYGVIASIHAAATGFIVTKAQNLALATAGIVVLTIVVWLIAKPFRSVTRPATGQQAADAMTSAGDNAASMPGRWFGGITSGLGALAGSYLGSKPRGGGSPGAAPESPHQDQPESIRSNPLPYPLPWPNMPPPNPPAPSPPAPPNPPGSPGGSYPVLVPEVEGGPDGAPALSGGPSRPPLPPGAASDSAELPAAESRVTIAIEAPGNGSPVPIGVSPAGGGTGRYEYELEPELFRPDQVVIPGEVVSVRDDLVVSHAPLALAEPERGPDGRLTAEVFRPDSELVGAR